MRRKLPWFEIALGIVFLSAYIYAALSDAYNLPNRWFIRDDAYYYYKVAQNISEGHGSTFDGIHPTNGYHPLWMLVNIPIFALARYNLILPLRVLAVVIGLLQYGTAVLLYRLIRATISLPVAMLAAAYWAFDSHILVFLYKTGVESSVALFTIMVLLMLALKLERTWRAQKVSAGQMAGLGIAGALVIFGRLDLVFFGLIMGIWIVFRGSPLRYLLPLDMLAVFVSVLLAFLARLGVQAYYDASDAALVMCILALLIEIPLFYFAGLYAPPSSWKPLPFLGRIAAATIAGGIVVAAVLTAGAALGLIPPVPRTTLLYSAGITLVFMILIRGVAYAFRARREPQAALAPLEELRTNAPAWLRDGTIYYGIVGGTLALYMLWNKLAFGSFSPVSGEVKRWWGSFWISVYGGPAKNLLSFLALNSYNEFDAWHSASTLVRNVSNAILYRGEIRWGNTPWQVNYMIALVVTFALILGFLLLRRRHSARAVAQAGMIPLFVGSWFQALSYNMTGYASPKEWYWLTEPLLLVILAALLLDVLIQLVLRRWAVTRLAVWALVAVFALRGGLDFWRDTVALNPYTHSRHASPYPPLVPFLEKHTPPGSIIGMTGGGNVGYFIKDRTVVNMDGLINSAEYFENLKSGTGSNYLYASGMRYVFANPGLLEANPYRGQYEGRLMGISTWGGKDVMKLLPDAAE